MRISGCLITKNGITCLDRNFINDYIFGYILLRFIEIIAKDVIIKINNTENFNYLSAEIDFS
tara:strand:- start:16 stop:201 length:186 start_codon:yes stop_codon:yes gene_type:complete